MVLGTAPTAKMPERGDQNDQTYEDQGKTVLQKIAIGIPMFDEAIKTKTDGKQRQGGAE